MYATHKKYGNMIFHINCDFNGTYFLYCYMQRATPRGKMFRSFLYRKNDKGKYEQILLGGICKKEDIKIHKRLPRRIKKLLLTEKK